MYAPRKVFIIEDGGYTELTYKEFCLRSKTDPSYLKKLFIPIHGMIMEVSKEDYDDFYKKQRRQKYLDERSAENGDISYDMLTTDDFNGEDILIDYSVDIEAQVIRKIMLDELRAALPFLSVDEQELIRALFFSGMSEREYPNWISGRLFTYIITEAIYGRGKTR